MRNFVLVIKMENLVIFFLCIIISFVNTQEAHLDGRIVGGKITSIEKFPYQVSVRYEDRHMCGGSVLDETTILTACHCVNGYDHSRYNVRVGSTVHNVGKSFKVTEVIEHENFNKNILYDNDAAILKIDKPLKFSKRIQPIALKPQGLEIPAGTIGIVTGWGLTEEGDAEGPLVLRMVDVAVISRNECMSKYETFTITNRMMCAQTPNHDSCQGDSGGPLAANGTLIGIVSWGFGCARPEYPGVYTKISQLHNWILSKAQQ